MDTNKITRSTLRLAWFNAFAKYTAIAVALWLVYTFMMLHFGRA